MRRYIQLTIFGVAFVMALAAVARLDAEDSYFEINVNDLKIIEGELPAVAPDGQEPYRLYFSDPRREAIAPEVVANQPAEAYLVLNSETTAAPLPHGDTFNLATARLLVKSAAGEAVTGILRLPGNDFSGMKRVKFSIPQASTKKIKPEEFYEAKLRYYTALEQRQIPGTAWFGHQIRETEKQLRGESRSPNPNGVNIPPDFADAYALFSGGRAIGENLQLTRTLRGAVSGEQNVPVDSLPGITVAEINWKPLLKDTEPKLDPLAKRIPADQHAIFFPTFEAALKLSDEAKGGNADLMRLAEPRSEDTGTIAFYQRQLGLPLSVLARALGGKVVQSVAVTGSDPYFRVGTDVAVILETKNSVVVMAALLTQIQNSAQQEQRVAAEQSKIDGVPYHSFVTPNRQLSSYVAQLDDAVIVTNSHAQLKNLVAVFKGKPSLASLDEFKFFRQRYPLGDDDETAFAFLSDATIRRWCSAKWRIASARRTFAAGALAELTAEYAKDIALGKVEAGAIHTDLPLLGAGKLQLTARGVESSNFGTLAWMTPIAEMPIDKVTQAEADAYNNWRTSYQRNWRWAFDPIGLRIGINKEKLAADLTVMPLIAGSDYSWLVGLARGAKIATQGGDQHDSLMQVACAINTKSQTFAQANQMAGFVTESRGGPRIDPLGWMGETVSFYVDDDPIWNEAAKLTAKERYEFFQKNVGRFPAALYVDVKDSLRLTAFLAALRAFIEPAAPGMLIWETLSYRDEAYVKVTPTRQGQEAIPADVDRNVSLYYAPSAKDIVFSLNEGVLKRAIDRRLDRRTAKEAGADGKLAIKSNSTDNDADSKPIAKTQPWLGESVCLQVDQRMFEIFKGSIFSGLDRPDADQALMQSRAWGNLPILNEWKRLFPDQDPVEIHERLWHTKLICPGGGEYVWNDTWKTMESTVYGHPGEPKIGPSLPAALQQFQSANFGLTFEPQGLRARFEIINNNAESK